MMCSISFHINVLLPFCLFSRQVFGEVTEQRGFSQVKLGIRVYSLVFSRHVNIHYIEIQYTVYNTHSGTSILMWALSKSMTVTSTTPSEVIDVIAHSLSVLDHWVAQLLLCNSNVWGKNCIVGASATFIRGLLRFGGNISENSPARSIQTSLKLHWDLCGSISTMTNCISWSRPCWFAFKKKLCHKKYLRLSFSKLS